jgi:multicomponent K+:H+ antiporter subunit G
MIADIAIAALLVVGGLFTVVGAFGLARLPDFFMRLHGPTKATTLGVGSFLVASMIYFVAVGDGLRMHKVLITAFLFLTAPVSAHLLARAGMKQRLAGAPAQPGADERA